MRSRHAAQLLAAAFVLLTSVIVAAPASAEPATAVAFVPGGASTRFTGAMLDTCAAPSAATMNAWLASPYRAVGVYISGVNRSCRQPNLTASWVTGVNQAGWRLVPIAVGPQAPCSVQTGYRSISTADPKGDGVATAGEAADAAGALGMLPGSALYVDVENYRPGDAGCRAVVLSYLSGWTLELHRRGYLSGVYGGLGSAIRDLAAAYSATDVARPDAVWVARWDGSTALTGWSGVPDSRWAAAQRLKQHTGDHRETFGGVSLVIDSSAVDAPVATVAWPFRVTAATSLNRRAAPSTAAPVVGRLTAGATANVVCQTEGAAGSVPVGGTTIWNMLNDGTFVSDRYVSTPAKDTYSPTLPRCAFASQVDTPTSLNIRSGPSPATTKVGSLPAGALAWTRCQQAGEVVVTTGVWDLIDRAGYVSDHYLVTSSRGPFTPGVPRC